MNMFQRVRLESDSFYQNMKKFDTTPGVQEALKNFTDIRNKLMLQLDVKVANYDFDGAIDLMHDEFQMLEKAVYRLKEAVEETQRSNDEPDNDFDNVGNIYNPMEDGDVDIQ